MACSLFRRLVTPLKKSFTASRLSFIEGASTHLEMISLVRFKSGPVQLNEQVSSSRGRA